ncbi:hypothetical protein LCGC14_1822050 [marine sediment metagenome]|uniref:Uncharacterized protein n=1 Tax=marine sediment metagenome TaxID=412755 RepID=A0A0F9GIL7_9ZZZZ
MDIDSLFNIVFQGKCPKCNGNMSPYFEDEKIYNKCEDCQHIVLELEKQTR